ncbi:MAG: hypothetical protein WBJ10_10160 [Daejeonella sp.]|uniref:hypothetical protein n=1 Tax=Daejeonella sp. TaxID=2805397 RepID=UPI003C70997F
MIENQNNPRKDQKDPDGAEHQGNELDMGNDMSMGSVSGAGVSDFNQNIDLPETEEQEYREGGGEGDDSLSDDNGINPSPAEVEPNPAKSAQSSVQVENADEDKLNPYPDEMKTDDSEDEKLKSTWMMSGLNRKI